MDRTLQALKGLLQFVEDNFDDEVWQDMLDHPTIVEAAAAIDEREGE